MAPSSEVTSLAPRTADAQGHLLSVESNHSRHQLENLEKQDEEEEASANLDSEFDEESWVFLALEAILYIPMLIQSLLGSLQIVKSILLGKSLQSNLEKASNHAPWWLQRYNAVFHKIDSNSWPPPSFLLLAALTIVALIVHPDGFTWVLLQEARYVSHADIWKVDF